MLKTTDIEKIIDEVLNNSSLHNNSHPIRHDDIDPNLYDDVSITRSPIKYIEPRDQRAQ